MNTYQNKKSDEKQTKKTGEKYKHAVFITCIFTFSLLALFTTLLSWIFVKKESNKNDVNSMIEQLQELKQESVEGQNKETKDNTDRPEARKVNILDGTYIDKVSYMADLAGKYADDKDNYVYSPVSFDMALMLIYPGADNTSKDLLSSYLEAKNGGKKKFAQIAKAYNQKPTEENTTKLTFANSIWYCDDCDVIDEYKDKISDFKAEISSFSPGSEEKTIDEINQWVSEKTEGTIEKILDRGQDIKNSSMILVNALYFYSEWESEWSDPYLGTFHGTEAKETDFIRRSNENFYYENDRAVAFSVKYKNGMDFYGILPKWEGDFTLTDLDITSLIKNKVSIDRVYSTMPVLKLENSIDMAKAVEKTELKEILFPDAFPYITDTKNQKTIEISKILQKSMIEINKNSTEASAVTALGTIDGVLDQVKIETESIEIELTRPFAFMIYDEKNDAILFIGKVSHIDG